MAHKHRDESPGIHHVTCRGNNKRSIFEDDHDELEQLERIRRVLVSAETLRSLLVILLMVGRREKD